MTARRSRDDDGAVTGATGPGDLHVVVLAYGPEGEHVELVESLLGAGVRPDRLTVVHNPASGGAGPPPLPAGRLVRMPRNVGYGTAMNAGVRDALAAGARTLLLLTHDARLPPAALAELLAAADRAPDFGALGPALLARGEARPWSYGAVGAPWEWPVHRTEPAGVEATRVAPCDWIDGAALLVRRAALEAAGPFDERYFMYFEEPDLCLRLRRAGWRVGVAVDAVAEQRPGARSRRGAYMYLDTRNGLEYARRLGGAPAVRRRARRHLAYCWRIAKWIVKDFRDPAVREEVIGELVPILAGLAHFALRRWGPPPGWLPGLGDVET